MKTTCPACGHHFEPKPTKVFYSDDAKAILACLNRLSGKKFRNTKHSLEHIQARLNDGYTKDACIKVLDLKIKHSWFVENNNFNPQTIFRPGNFERYVNENPAPNSDHILKTANTQAKNVMAAIRDYGANVDVNFQDNITSKVISKHFKGWRNVCRSEEKFFHRNFVSSYVELAKKANI